jgi:hypothetical protein
VTSTQNRSVVSINSIGKYGDCSWQDTEDPSDDIGSLVVLGALDQTVLGGLELLEVSLGQHALHAVDVDPIELRLLMSRER